MSYTEVKNLAREEDLYFKLDIIFIKAFQEAPEALTFPTVKSYP